jgi:sugar transferase (PEP-CTERM/EpsH1 system associated)
VLYLTHRVPFPPDKGDRIRNYHLLRAMARRAPVWLGSLADEPVPPETLVELKKLCAGIAIVPVGKLGRWLRAGASLLGGHSLSEGLFSTRGLRDVIREWTGRTRFHAAVVSASSLAPYLRSRPLEGTPAVVDLVDVDSQKWRDFAAASRPPKSWLYRLESRRVRKLETALPKWTRAVAMVSRAEGDVYEAFAGSGTATIAPNGVDLDYFSPTDAATNLTCAFVGAMDYLPNVDGAVWFATEVWPMVRGRFPAAEYWIIGRNPSPAVRELSRLPGVVVTGSVPDVRPLVASARVVIAPLRLARGIQNKVLEALAMGKPVVAAPPALAALRARVGVDLLSATSPLEWRGALSELFCNPQFCREMGMAGRRYVEKDHHWESCLAPLLDRIFPPTADAAGVPSSIP